MKKFDYVVLMFLLIVIISGIEYVLVGAHENIHERIMLTHGCEKVKIHNNVFSGSARCVERGEVTQEMLEEEKRLHLLNEMASYTPSGTRAAIYGVGGLIITALALIGVGE